MLFRTADKASNCSAGSLDRYVHQAKSFVSHMFANKDAASFAMPGAANLPSEHCDLVRM